MKKIARELRKECLRLSYNCKDGNLQSVFSCIDIMWVLYDKIMNWSPKMAQNEARDYFLISKGQATLGLFAILQKKGFFSEDELEDIGTFHSKFSNQADYTKFQGGIENSAGSLGHGFPLATGIAYGKKIKNISSRVFVLVGDGELNEGSIWETCIFAAGKKLDNLCLIIDDNDSVSMMIDMGNIEKKLQSFGFRVAVIDGHNYNEIEETLNFSVEGGEPMAVLAKTKRGYGSATMMRDSIWFHKAPNEEELRLLMQEVDLF